MVWSDSKMLAGDRDKMVLKSRRTVRIVLEAQMESRQNLRQSCGASRGGCRKKDRSTFYARVMILGLFSCKNFEVKFPCISFVFPLQNQWFFNRNFPLQHVFTKIDLKRRWPHEKLIGLFFCNPLTMLHKTAEGFGMIPSELRVLLAQFASISVPKCHDRLWKSPCLFGADHIADW